MSALDDRHRPALNRGRRGGAGRGHHEQEKEKMTNKVNRLFELTQRPDNEYGDMTFSRPSRGSTCHIRWRRRDENSITIAQWYTYDPSVYETTQDQGELPAPYIFHHLIEKDVPIVDNEAKSLVCAILEMIQFEDMPLEID
jgi:hypothetical protein